MGRPLRRGRHEPGGLLVLTYLLYNCWPSEYVASPAVDQDADVVAMASMTIEHERWERDPRPLPSG